MLATVLHNLNVSSGTAYTIKGEIKLNIQVYSESNTDILKSNDPKLALISFDGKRAIVGDIDEAVEHNILLEKTNHSSTDIDKYFRIVFDKESADWTFVCPSNYRNITDKVKRITAFYNDGFAFIAKFLSEIGYYSDINIPKRYRRHFNMMSDNTII